MTQVRNQRDKLLRLAKNRVLNPIGSGIRLSLSAPGFHVLANNQVDIGVVTVEAELINIVGDVVFTSFNSPLSNVTALTADASYTGDMGIITATVTNSAGTFTRSVIIPVLRDGAIGTSSYVWIKYADDASGNGLSDLPEGKKYIAIAQNKLTPTESNDPADYSYVLVKGSDATSLRMWIKYSDSPDGSNPYDTPTDNTMYIGIAVNKDDPVESTNKADYVWSRFRGGDGVSIPGSRGAGFYRTAGNAWSDDTANAATPGGNEIGDMVTISNGTVSYTKVWDGDSWENPGAFLSGDLFVEKSIGASKILANGLSIYTPAGVMILDANKTIPGQIPNGALSFVQIGGDMAGTNWNGHVGPGGAGWYLDRDGEIYLNGANVRGRITGSVIESSAFKIESGRMFSTYDRLCPFSINDQGMQMWSSGSGDCDVQLRDFVSAWESVPYSYNVKRFSEFVKDIYLEANVASIGDYGNVILEVMYNDDGWWRLIAIAPLRVGSLSVKIRYTSKGGDWMRMHLRARTDGGSSTSLSFAMEMNNLNTALYLGETNSGISVNAPPPPPPPPPYEEPPPDDPYCVDYETTHLPSGRLARHLVVDDLVQVWDDNAESPSIEYAPALQIRLGYEQSYWMRSESGAEIIQSKSTPMTLRDGRVATTDAMLGEEVLVNRFGILTWEPVVELVDMGIRRVVKLSLGDRMFFAGIHPDATIATHNQQYKP